MLSLFRRTAGVSSQPLSIKPSVFILSTARVRISIIFPQCESHVNYGHLSATINDWKQHLFNLIANGYQLYAPRFRTSPRCTAIAVIDVSSAVEGVGFVGRTRD